MLSLDLKLERIIYSCIKSINLIRINKGFSIIAENGIFYFKTNTSVKTSIFSKVQILPL